MRTRVMYMHTFQGYPAFWDAKERRVYCASREHPVILVANRRTVLRRNERDYQRDIREGLRRERELWGCLRVKVPR